MQATDTIGLTEDQAVERLMGTPEAEPEEQETETPEDVEATDDAEPADSEQTDEDEDETEDGHAEGEEEDEDDSESEESDKEPQLYTVREDGVEKQVTLEELTQSFAGQSYIQRRMQENAETSKQAKAALETLQAERERVAALYQSLEQGGIPQAPQKPDPSMLETDPIGYMAAKDQYETQKAEYDQRISEIKEERAKQAQTQQQMHQAFLKEQQALLTQHIPDFADPAKREGLQRKMRETGTTYGFDETELSGIADARIVRVLHDAMRFRELQAGKTAKKAEQPKATALPPKKSSESPKAKKTKELRQRLKQSGSVEDAVAFLMQT